MSSTNKTAVEQENEEKITELYLPKYCILEAPIRLCAEVSESAKIYFGELAVLASKYNYIPYKDEQLAKMKEVDVRTIKRWHQELEANRFIRKVTISKLIKKEACKWKRERKIYINQNRFSNKECEGDKNVPLHDGDKNVPLDEGDKNVPLIKQDLNLDIRQQQAVVVSSCPLDLLNLPEDYKLKQRAIHSSEKIELLVEYVRVWEGRSGDLIACNTILKQWDTWGGSVAKERHDGQPTDDQQQLIDSRKERAEIIKKKFNLNLDIKTDRIELVTFSKSGKRSFVSIGFMDDTIEKFLKKYEEKE